MVCLSFIKLLTKTFPLQIVTLTNSIKVDLVYYGTAYKCF